MATPTESHWYDAQHYVDIKPDGTLCYQSIFQREWPGDFEMLMACIEDNSFEVDDDGEESIDWYAVRRDCEGAS